MIVEIVMLLSIAVLNGIVIHVLRSLVGRDDHAPAVDSANSVTGSDRLVTLGEKA